MTEKNGATRGGGLGGVVAIIRSRIHRHNCRQIILDTVPESSRRRNAGRRTLSESHTWWKQTALNRRRDKRMSQLKEPGQAQILSPVPAPPGKTATVFQALLVLFVVGLITLVLLGALAWLITSLLDAGIPTPEAIFMPTVLISIVVLALWVGGLAIVFSNLRNAKPRDPAGSQAPASRNRGAASFRALLALLAVGLITFFLLAGLVWLITSLSKTDSATAEAVLTPTILVSIVVLALSLGGLAIVLKNLGIASPKDALGLPPGSIRALIALLLILLFLVLSLFLFGQLRAAEAEGEVPETLENFAMQLLTTMSTLVVAVAAFYFGSQSVQAATVATRAQRQVPAKSLIAHVDGSVTPSNASLPGTIGEMNAQVAADPESAWALDQFIKIGPAETKARWDGNLWRIATVPPTATVQAGNNLGDFVEKPDNGEGGGSSAPFVGMIASSDGNVQPDGEKLPNSVEEMNAQMIGADPGTAWDAGQSILLGDGNTRATWNGNAWVAAV